MSGSTQSATGVDVVDGGLADALAVGWHLLVRGLVVVGLLVWTGFWGTVAYINVSNADVVGGLLTIGLLVASVAVVGVVWRR